MIQFDRYPGGKQHVLTMSYDDGRSFDYQLVDIFNRYHIRGTFHLNSSAINKEGYVSEKDIKTLYSGHEVSCHTATHPNLTQVPSPVRIQEIYSDRIRLEKLCGYIVRGMSWPYGSYDSDSIDAAKQCGIVYSRTVNATKAFSRPDHFLTWNPTCHHKDCLALADRFHELLAPYRSFLFYVWGHSYEFDTNQNWDMIEEFCKRMSGREDTWYATNIEIYDYIMAQNQLQFSADAKQVYNPTVTDVWIRYQNETVLIGSGKTVNLA